MRNIYKYENTELLVLTPPSFFWGGVAGGVPSTTMYTRVRIRIPITMCDNVKPSRIALECNKALFNKPVSSMRVVDYSEPPKYLDPEILIHGMLYQTPDQLAKSLGMSTNDLLEISQDLLQACREIIDDGLEHVPLNYRDWFFTKFNKIQ